MIGVEGHFRARQPEHEPRIVCADRIGDTQHPGLQRLNTSSRNQFLSLAENHLRDAFPILRRLQERHTFFNTTATDEQYCRLPLERLKEGSPSSTRARWSRKSRNSGWYRYDGFGFRR